MKNITLPAVILAALIIIGCSTTPPTATERKFYDITTNLNLVVTWQTNTLYRTNTVVETITVTNQIGQVVPIMVTNLFSVPVPQIIPIYTTNQTYNYTQNANAEAVKGVAGTIGNIAAPGVGGPIASGIAGLAFALWAWVRGSKASATANNLAQTIEVARQLIQSLPNGKNLDNQLTTWMQQHQAEAGVLPQVLSILQKSVDNPAAKQVADQLTAALAALQSPPTARV